MSDVGAYVIDPVEAYQVLEVPRDEMRIVYFLRCVETGRIKIGITDKVHVRLNELQRTSPTELKCLVQLASRGNNLEAFLHRKYNQYRLHGEWFGFDGDAIKELNEMIVDYWEICVQTHLARGHKAQAEEIQRWLQKEPIPPFVKPSTPME